MCCVPTNVCCSVFGREFHVFTYDFVYIRSLSAVIALLSRGADIFLVRSPHWYVVQYRTSLFCGAYA